MSLSFGNHVRNSSSSARLRGTLGLAGLMAAAALTTTYVAAESTFAKPDRAASEPVPSEPIPDEGAPGEEAAAADRGFHALLHNAFLPSDFDQRVFDELWQSWPESLRQRVADASTAQRRTMAFDRYGLTPREQPHRTGEPAKPLQYVVDDDGKWTMNCFACHGGSVYGTPTPGAPNNRFALQTLTEDVRSTKFRLGIPLGRMELGSLVIPLGTTHGTTNAVVFGMGLMHYRDDALNVVARPPASFTHHDMDAPPWWHYYRRPYLYIDGFAQKGHRGLMQFTLVPENDAAFYHDNEETFRDIHAYLSSLRPPQYPGQIDASLAATGKHLFEQNCAHCHGTYGHATDVDSIAAYPNRMIPIDEIGTDPVRHTALNVAGREHYSRSWFAHAGEPGEQTTLTEPSGYVAPPLDGVWASAPYFHNGSVPTLRHVLYPSQRPEIWRRVEESLDEKNVGLTIETVRRVPLENPDVALRRSYFDTRRFGKSAVGHDYPDELTDEEKNAVLEYLKTL